jgi:hypothetical protein
VREEEDVETGSDSLVLGASREVLTELRVHRNCRARGSRGLEHEHFCQKVRDHLPN